MAKGKPKPSSLILDSGGGVTLHLDPSKDRDELKQKVQDGWTVSDPDGLLDSDPNQLWFIGVVSKFWSDSEIKAGDHKPKKKIRARTDKGHFIPDDPATPENEAYN
ncbi:MAG: hypothetical protein CMB80_12450 [Flammeovirgaceae bacterium]|nr:hypothetical protein [Flammeovirgaceae bacterium]